MVLWLTLCTPNGGQVSFWLRWVFIAALELLIVMASLVAKPGL